MGGVQVSLSDFPEDIVEPMTPILEAIGLVEKWYRPTRFGWLEFGQGSWFCYELSKNDSGSIHFRLHRKYSSSKNNVQGQ